MVLGGKPLFPTVEVAGTTAEVLRDVSDVDCACDAVSVGLEDGVGAVGGFECFETEGEVELGD